MTNRLFTLLLFASPVAFGQQDSSGFHPGLEVSGVYSSVSDFGLLPSVTCTFGQHRIAVGPRLRVNSVYLKETASVGNYTEYVFFLSYRYYPLRNAERFRPFVQAQLEYGVYNSVYHYSYDTNSIHLHGPIFDHNFTGRQKFVEHDYAVCIGPGIDVSLWRGLYFTTTAGVGLGSRRWEQEITNDNGTVEYSENVGWQTARFEWFASAGFGYRF